MRGLNEDSMNEKHAAHAVGTEKKHVTRDLQSQDQKTENAAKSAPVRAIGARSGQSGQKERVVAVAERSD